MINKEIHKELKGMFRSIESMNTALDNLSINNLSKLDEVEDKEAKEFLIQSLNRAKNNDITIEEFINASKKYTNK